MAKAAKNKRKPNYLNGVFITGRLRFPKLNEPDQYGDGKPAYKADIIPDAEEFKRVRKLLTDFAEECWPDAEKRWLPIKKDKKDDSIVFFSVKTTKTNDDGEVKRPLIVDSKRKPVPRSIEIGGGTIAKVKCTGIDFEATKLTDGLPGVTLMLETVQIKKLVKARDALEGFADEDGFSVDGEEDIEAGGDDSSEGSTGGDAYDL